MEEKSFKIKEVLNSVGRYLLLFAGYLIIPSVISLLVYDKLELSETTSILIGNLSFIIILVLIYFEMLKEKLKDFINNRQKYMKLGFKCWGLGLLVMYIANIILVYFIFSDIAANEELNRSFIVGNPLIGLFSVALFAPFVEEMVFRYGLKKVFPNTKYFPLISAVFFGVPHALTGMSNSMSLLSNLSQLLYVIPYGALGYAFGYIYKKTDNIYVSMAMHALHNFLCFIIILKWS